MVVIMVRVIIERNGVIANRRVCILVGSCFGRVLADKRRGQIVASGTVERIAGIAV